MATSQNQEKFYDYEGFVEKFKPKLTTDDCYTPPLIMEAVNEWVSKEYGVDRMNFVRPFYPGGDFESEDYTGKIVVDNPPFSILSRILQFYIDNGVKFFLFAPTLSGLVRYSDICTALSVGVDVKYENGAVVHTSFVTNLEPHSIRMRTAPTLYQAVNEANERNKKQQTKTLPKYVYPPEVITSAQMYPLNKYGIDLVLDRSECGRISKLDAQNGNVIFGCGLLLSKRLRAERERAERERAERERAERERAERYELSWREKQIVELLSK